MDAGVVVAAVLGVAVAGALWWLYFDIVALVAERRLSNAAEGRERNEIARDSFSYLHFPMVAGIVLLALGLKKTLEHVEDPLKLVPAVALLGGYRRVPARPRGVQVAQRAPLQRRSAWCAPLVLAALHPRWRWSSRRWSRSRSAGAALAALIAYETVHFAELRDRLRHQLAAEPAGD